MKKISSLIIILLTLSTLGFATTLPRIDLTFDTLSSETFHPGTVRFIENNDTIFTPMKVRHRGASSLRYDKPSYAVKLCDSLGNKVEKKLLGMRKSHYWILDAMASDKARMRNRVSMDLWLNFSRKPWYYEMEPKMINGYQGQMVEVYVNNLAQGIYCLMERVDRKQLKTQKYIDTLGVQGAIYKNTKYSLLSRYYIDPRNPKPDSTDRSGQWDGFEQKEPDWEDGEPICWDPLYRHVTAIYKTTNRQRARDSLRTHLDIPVYIDYVLHCQLLSARDNLCKNLYLSLYHVDSLKMLYTPWDMDHSWGRQYNSTEEDVNTTVDFYGTSFLYKRFATYCGIQDSLENRYAELRKHYFTINYIDSLFAKYFDLYARTGMDTIEQKIWSGHNNITFDIPSEQAYIHNWVEGRLEYLDSMYHYVAPVPPSPTDTLLQYVLSMQLPVIRITTTDGQDPTSDDIEHPDGLYGNSITNIVSKEARMEIFRGDSLWYDSGNFLDKSSGIKIRHRGNTSAYQHPNKPFKLSLQAPANLIPNQPGDTIDRTDKNWVLLNNSKSIKSLIGYQLGILLKMEYAPRIEPVNIILNNKYYGIYLLGESVQRNPACRINVHENEGYIIEYDYYFWNEDYSIPSSLASTRQWTLKYPSLENLTPNQEYLIQQDIRRFEQSVDNNDYPSVIDVPSFAKWLMVQDILSNSDAGGTNPFIARTDSTTSLIRMPVLWDFDGTLADAFSWSATHSETSYVFGRFFQNPDNRAFIDAYFAQWDTVVAEQVFEQLITYLTELPNDNHGIGLDLSYTHHRSQWDTDSISPVANQCSDAIDYFTQHYEWMMMKMQELKKLYNISTMSNSPNQAFPTQKIWSDGQLYILRGKDQYNIYGRKIEHGK